MIYEVEAIKVAGRSSNLRHKTGAVIMDQRGNVVSKGWSHTGEWRYGSLYSVHAEIHALMRGRGIQDLTDCVIYIATVSAKSGNIRNAMPCLSCATALVGYGIEDAYFTSPVRGANLKYIWERMYLPRAIESAELKVYKSRD